MGSFLAILYGLCRLFLFLRILLNRFFALKFSVLTFGSSNISFVLVNLLLLWTDLDWIFLRGSEFLIVDLTFLIFLESIS